MGVGVGKGGQLGVSCASLDGLEVHASGNLQGGKGVPQAVRGEVWQAVLVDELIQPVIDRVRVDRAAVILDKKPVIAAVPPVAVIVPQLVPPRLIFGQHGHDLGRQLYYPLAGFILCRNLLDTLAGQLLTCPEDMYDTLPIVHVLPGETAQLTAPDARV